jgi:hypothetical protein
LFTIPDVELVRVLDESVTTTQCQGPKL